MFEEALSMARRSSSVSSTSAAPRFSVCTFYRTQSHNHIQIPHQKGLNIDSGRVSKLETFDQRCSPCADDSTVTGERGKFVVEGRVGNCWPNFRCSSISQRGTNIKKQQGSNMNPDTIESGTIRERLAMRLHHRGAARLLGGYENPALQAEKFFLEATAGAACR